MLTDRVERTLKFSELEVGAKFTDCTYCENVYVKSDKHELRITEFNGDSDVFMKTLDEQNGGLADSIYSRTIGVIGDMEIQLIRPGD